MAGELILIVEDNEKNMKLVRDLLQFKGYRTLEAESGLNDAPTVVLVTVVSTGGGGGILSFLGLIAYELVAGTIIGAAVGFGAAWLMRRSALPSSGLYPLSVLAFTVFAYAGSAAIHASGFAAVYVAALVLGDARLSG